MGNAVRIAGVAGLALVLGAAAGAQDPAAGGGLPEQRAETAAERKLLDHCNLYRAALDLPPLVRDAKLSWDCLKHAWYQDRNNKTGHPEDAGLPGYSPEGHAAGMASVLAYTSPTSSVDMWMDSFLHRIPCITPTGHRAGVGWHSGKAVTSALLDTRRGADRARGRAAELHWPPDGMTGAPTRMSAEQPNPTPYPSSNQAGYPVTCTFHPSRRVDKAKAQLWFGMTAIPCFFSSPDQPTRHGAALQQNTICLIPEKPLPHGKTLRVEMEAVVDGTPWRAQWTFTTGSRTAGFKWMEKRRAERRAREAAAKKQAAKAAKVAKIQDLKEAKKQLLLTAGVLRVVPDASLGKAIAEARRTREALPEAMQPELDRALQAAEKRLDALVEARLDGAAAAAKAGEPGKLTKALNDAVALAHGLAPWTERIAAARRKLKPATPAGNSGSAQQQSAPGWMTLLTDKLTNAWDGPTAHAGHLKREDGGLHLMAKQDAVSIAYLYFTDDWKDYEVKAEVQVTAGAALVVRARLEKGEYKGHYLWLDPTTAGQWVTLHAVVSGNTVKLTCGDQTIEETIDASAKKGGLIFAVQPKDERLKVKNVRVKK